MLELDTQIFDYIYMIVDEHDHVKVGISKNPESRIKQLQTGHSDTLKLYHKEEFECNRNHLLKIERLIHKEIRSRGFKRRGEWFSVPTECLSDIKDIVAFSRIRYESDDTYFKYRKY